MLMKNLNTLLNGIKALALITIISIACTTTAAEKQPTTQSSLRNLVAAHSPALSAHTAVAVAQGPQRQDMAKTPKKKQSRLDRCCNFLCKFCLTQDPSIEISRNAILLNPAEEETADDISNREQSSCC